MWLVPSVEQLRRQQQAGWAGGVARVWRWQLWEPAGVEWEGTRMVPLLLLLLLLLPSSPAAVLLLVR